MGAVTGIEWTDKTFNLWTGCEQVGPGCDHCYAAAWAKRAGRPELWAGERRLTTEANRRQPLKWNQTRHPSGRRWRVFGGSLMDPFDNQVPEAWRTSLWDLVRECDNLTWIFVTKRIGNATRMLPADWGDGWSHVWLLATVCTQAEADRDVPKLLDTPATVRGVSIEPMLGPVRLKGIPGGPDDDEDVRIDALEGHYFTSPRQEIGTPMPRLDWVIVGGESGPGRRHCEVEWIESLAAQCAAAGTACFVKQDMGARPGMRGRLPEVLWARKEFPA